MTESANLSRRTVLKQAAWLAAPLIVPATALGREGRAAPSERITLGMIGFGPRGKYDLTAMLKHADLQCVALCEVQASRREAGKKFIDGHYGNQDCQTYGDFREMLERKDIDAVLVATGDRWHAAASILAAKAGKDVYSEKPCGITIQACQELADTMIREKRVFQAGTQRRSVVNFQKAVELVHSGKIGKLHTMHASVYFPTLDNTWLPAQPMPPKAVVDWNLWLGPAAWRPFNQQYCDGRWRGHWDFDSGARLLDWGAHTVDLCQWANQADDTLPVEYEPTDTNIVCRYANGVKLILDFLKTPFGDRSPHYISRLGTCPVRFVGDQGSVETGDSGELVVTPDALQKEVASTPRVVGLDVGTHSRNFLDCIRSRKPTAANPEVMRRSHIACHAAALAWILGRKLKMDPAKETFLGDDEANLLRSRPTRQWAI
ncbi:Gfo/Idh/MocA family protein [Tuwongella immobilis]|uniref:Gfo/Idh/MocA-like oxidoreductase N-terminal domain-containing protein n=1 Tax=Tuwongella immobilis TaxID=692036 RepID=A0A6C2YVU7_9BACT|nr:Gfo/Idh/MocA family oxidoreductase [Tuwongella immobilis]VIP05293.1 oxidoreductase domain-containing protein : Oxidoreductase domain protein OS=Pirellula staleyi (strain ATCC 27377 / DSM 6068 / ICPB 4128) GN=Psta_3520 PE=4 SV=1: GFO_IDH_MocA [Tuwongella immobilis]VTS07942.1 oxidoreductase domain-containing protein : Oxidoreductase domain protein OS=Pirellula staleyi (strain ATCC 27377 / DSM 6068 / ICPB 4128) GN=Psta_3520 PE=4 SV=1: GFO_IDH_MocA [Tuwongella immobilis]